MDLKQLIGEYSVSGPRYTSYPTAPQWKPMEPGQYETHLKNLDPKGRTFGLYLHLPFCQSLCYYCGCNIQITNAKSRSLPYVDAAVAEIHRVGDLLGKMPLNQVSWGGGTPTFPSVAELERLFEAIVSRFSIAPTADVSVEVDPRVTSDEQLVVMRKLGFNRISMGVQDFNPEVQKAVNRIQPEADTEAMLIRARELGYEGINFDLIYGLPLQDLASFQKTVESVIRMRPDRIALYNYARLPDMLKHQKILEKYPFATPAERVDIFLMAFDRLTQAGYVAIGMDHFALKEDGLARAMDQGTLYRNFMGYVAQKNTDLIGIGCSAIGEVGDGFFQNEKTAKTYQEKIGGGGFATLRGHFLSEDDRIRKWTIQRLMCQFRLNYKEFEDRFGKTFSDYFPHVRLEGFAANGVLVLDKEEIRVTELGRIFVRNVAMEFDAYLDPKQGQYSKTV